MAHTKYFVDKDKISWKKVEDQTVVLNMERGFYFVFDKISGYIWKMIVDQKGFDQIISKIIEEYNVDFSTCQKDVRNLLKEMESQSLIEKSQDMAESKPQHNNKEPMKKGKALYKKPTMKRYEQLHEIGVGS